jgi:hypothetical protein
MAQGISGNNIVGSYNDGGYEQAFVYNVIGQFYTILDVPGELDERAEGIDGNNIVGQYDTLNNAYGFLATPVPEPSGLVLLALGATAFLARRRR